MTVPANTFLTYSQVNIREDLINLIFNVDPYKTPILNTAKRVKATQTNHEWNTEALASQNLSNAAVQGDDASGTSLIATARLGNYTQISTKTIILSGTTQAVVAAGASNTMGHQVKNYSLALKRDMEGIITQNQAKLVGNSTTASLLGGLPCYLITNTQYNAASGANPTDGSGSHTRTYSSSSTAITETTVKALLQSVYKSSGEVPEYAFVSPANKQNISAFTGPGTRFIEVEDKTLNTAVDVYSSDFGDIKVVPDIFLANSHDTFWINPEYLRCAYLRPFFVKPLAPTGDADKRELIVEYTLEVGNEKAHGGIFDTTG